MRGREGGREGTRAKPGNQLVCYIFTSIMALNIPVLQMSET